MRNFNAALSLFLILMLTCCSSKELTREELENFILDPENGLFKELTIDDIKLEVYYKPKDLILAQNLDGVTDEVERDKISKELDSLDYFVLRFSKNGKEIENGYVSDPTRFNEVIDYLGFYMNNDLDLIIDNDTIPSLDIMYARTFGAEEATNVLTVFKSDIQHVNSDVKFRFEDSLFGTGMNEFNFDISKIKNTPKLKSRQL